VINGKKIDNGGNGNKSVIGDGNIIADEVHLHSTSEIKKDVMYKLLSNINDLSAKSNKVDPLDLTPYTREIKICYNNISIYKKHYDYFQDGSFIIQNQIEDFEENYLADFEKNIFRYIQGKYIEISSDEVSSDVIIKLLKSNITAELKQYYGSELSPEELVYVDFVIYYVFVRCKIFDKPPEDYVNTK